MRFLTEKKIGTKRKGEGKGKSLPSQTGSELHGVRAVGKWNLRTMTEGEEKNNHVPR